MRQKFKTQTPIIAEIKIPTDSRHRIYPMLIAMQEIYLTNKGVVDLVYADLLKNYSNTTNDVIEPILSDFLEGYKEEPLPTIENLGASGMTAWQVLVAVVLRQTMNMTYDDLEFNFNTNDFIREFLEIPLCDKELFSYSRLAKNCRKISPETIQAIDYAVVKLSIDMGFEDGKNIRSDSFACQTNIHHPSDAKAIQDGCNKILKLCVSISEGKDGWRQNDYWRKKIKTLVRNLSGSKRSKIKDENLKKENIKKAYQELIKKSRQFLEKSFKVLELPLTGTTDHNELSYYMSCLDMVLDLAEKRAINGEKIDKVEKIFSIFEPHTELIHRGKFPTPIEYGHRVIVSEGKSGMILDHKVMENGVLDQEEFFPLIERLKEKYGKIKVLSLDKGYNSKELNQMSKSDIADDIETLILPSKGYKNKSIKEHESKKSFVKLRMWRAGVEACIGTLMKAHGADKCRDKFYRGFCRWISACVLSRNLITLGNLILEQRANKKIA